MCIRDRVIVSLSPILFVYAQMMQSAYVIAAGLGQPGIILASTVVLSSLMVLVFSLTYVMSVFYFSRDLTLLVPLPLLPRDILGAKFFVVLILDYLTVAPFYLPALSVFGVNSGAGLLSVSYTHLDVYKRQAHEPPLQIR